MEAALRLGVFAALFALLVAAEAVVPWRAGPAGGRRRRWPANLAWAAGGVVAQRLTVGSLAVGAAAWARAHGWGLLPALGFPPWLAAPVAFVVLDLAVYAQHVATHAVPVLWRMHRVHHADAQVDATTAVRFHPMEIVLSAVWKAAVVVALGAAPWLVLTFEVVLNAAALFTHANIRLPGAMERALRPVVCTPAMHRIHHSVLPAETDANFGFFLSVWDRLFGTWRASAAGGVAGLRLGLPEDGGGRGARPRGRPTTLPSRGPISAG
jgi:sterol desaturase/sphingolipid hydroxylase (fatty acid hydroxylase superfamily)